MATLTLKLLVYKVCLNADLTILFNIFFMKVLKTKATII